jgi:HlyD family secretion protein
MANLDEFVQTLPGQYDFVVGEHGALLSGGQRQRIGIARALYNDAEVIVLDEPTSALDAITERDVITTLLRLRGSKTVVMISHRLSTMRNADQVLLLEGGRVQVSGPFDDVLARSPEFRELVAAGAHDGPLEADGSDAVLSSEYVLG